MKFDCIIIGAGAAGLMAAYELVKKKKHILILEARDRIGGRIYTLLPNGFSTSAQAGAEFIHGEAKLTSKLLKAAAMRSVETEGEMYQLRRGQLIQRDFFDNEWEVLLEELENVKSDMPFVKFLNDKFPKEKYPDFYESIQKFVEGYNAANMNDVSTLALKKEWSANENPKQYRPVGGYGNLMNYMAETIKKQDGILRLSQQVTEVQIKSGRAEVTTATGNQFESESVVITIPVSLLQKGSIKFTPALPQYEAAAKDIGFGSVIKFLFEFKEPLWENSSSRSFTKMQFAFSDAAVPTWWSQLPDKRSLLTGWLGGPGVKELKQDKDFLFDKATLSIAYILNMPQQEIHKQIQAWHIENWLVDQFSFGAYSYAKMETNEARKILREPVENVLYFGGEALSDEAATGTVESALSSGKEIAEKILSKS